jgi:hypothetical protein
MADHNLGERIAKLEAHVDVLKERARQATMKEWAIIAALASLLLDKIGKLF